MSKLSNIMATLMLLASWSSLLAQPVITSTSVPTIPSTVVITQNDTVGINAGMSGPNMTWDYSSITSTGGPVNNQYVDPMGTPFFTNFTSATHASTAGGNVYSYYTATSNDFQLIGIGLQVGSFVYLDDDKEMEFPFTYNDSFSDYYEAQQFGLGFTTFRWGNRTVTADGYGTLILPTGTYANCLRVHTHNEYKDSLSTATDSTVYVEDSWVWMQDGQPRGIFGVQVSTRYTRVFTQVTKSVWYTDAGLTAPTADFSASATNIMEGDTISFTDMSTGDPTSWAWTLNGATPASSTDQHPFGITYATAGTYDVQLIVTNPGGSDTLVKTAYITVDPDTSNQNTGLPALEVAGSFQVFPSPAHAVVTIQANHLKGSVATIELINTMGQVVGQWQVPVSHPSINKTLHLRSYDPGLYFLRMNTGQEMAIQRVVLE